MSQLARNCPRCGSGKTASRRQLFHSLMCDVRPQGVFSWYDDSEPQALPPKSLFFMLLVLIAVLSVPAVGFWLLEHYPAVIWLVSVAALLSAVLLVDILLTYRRYKDWVGQWLCGSCREVFAPATQ